MFVEGSTKTFAQGLFSISSVQKHILGTERVLSDGRKFVYAKAGGSNIDSGSVCQSSAPIAAHKNQLVKAAAAVGDKKVVMAIGATPLSLNQYAEGYLHVNAGPGMSRSYKIKGHAAYSANATNVEILLYDPIGSPLAANSSYVTLTAHPYSGLIVMPTAPTSTPVGVAPVYVYADHYFWLQTQGPVAVLTDGTLIVGRRCATSNTVAGAVEHYNPAEVNTLGTIVGRVLQVNATGTYSLVYLTL